MNKKLKVSYSIQILNKDEIPNSGRISGLMVYENMNSEKSSNAFKSKV